MKAIVFDFDGVIVESAEIKTEAFRKLFAERPAEAEQLVAYHLRNSGISRFVKFRHFFDEIAREPYTEEQVQELGRRFSELVLEDVMKAPLVAGTLEFLAHASPRYLLFIASGTPEEELTHIVQARGLAAYFTGIFGAPSTKVEIMAAIMKQYGLQKGDILFVGDGDSDRKAAQEAGAHFVLRSTRENGHLARLVTHRIDDLTQLNTTIEGIER
jgi:phosphoglycolate phosphatase-like HAD superfamily hydrolase